MPDVPVSPLFIEIALAYYYSGGEPWRQFTPAQWNSISAGDVRHRLHALGLLDSESQPTEGMRLYVEALLAVPLPVQSWAMPPRLSFEPVTASFST